MFHMYYFYSTPELTEKNMVASIGLLESSSYAMLQTRYLELLKKKDKSSLWDKKFFVENLTF